MAATSCNVVTRQRYMAPASFIGNFIKQVIFLHFMRRRGDSTQLVRKASTVLHTDFHFMIFHFNNGSDRNRSLFQR